MDLQPISQAELQEIEGGLCKASPWEEVMAGAAVGGALGTPFGGLGGAIGGVVGGVLGFFVACF